MDKASDTQEVYRRDYMRTIRSTHKEGHRDCEEQSCCYDGRRNYNRRKMAEYRAEERNAKAMAALKVLKRALSAEIRRELGI